MKLEASTHEDAAFDALAMARFEDGACWLVALDDWQISLIISSLRYAHWKRRWRDLGAHTWDEIEAKVDELEACLLMGCEISGLSDAIRYLADRLFEKQCDCPGSTGTGGAGGTSQPPSEVETGTPGEHTGDPPAGFSTWEEYDTYKCAVATAIVDQIIADLNYTAEIQLGSGVALETWAALIGAGLLSPIPGDEIIIIAGLSITALTLGVLSGLYSDLAGAINDGRSEIICALFNGGDCATAISDALQEADAQIDLGLGAIAAGLAKQIIRSWFTPDNINRLFEEDTTRNYPAGNCDDCTSTPPVRFTWYNYPSYAQTEFYPTYEGNGVYSFQVPEGAVQPGHGIEILIHAVGEGVSFNVTNADFTGWVNTQIEWWSLGGAHQAESVASDPAAETAIMAHGQYVDIILRSTSEVRYTFSATYTQVTP